MRDLRTSTEIALTNVIFKRAGFRLAGKDDAERLLEDTRRRAIMERLGQPLHDRAAFTKATFEDLEGFFDATMQEMILCNSRYISDVALFIDHAFSIKSKDTGPMRHPTVMGGFNRAKLAMEEDIQKIDRAIDAELGHGRGRF